VKARRRTKGRRQARLHLAPLAIASDGKLLINIAYVHDIRTLGAMSERLRKEKTLVFVGYIVGRHETELVLRRLDDAAAETAAVIAGGGRLGRG
jgi:hydrogenase maturation factor